MIKKTTQANLDKIGLLLVNKMRLLLEGYIGHPSPLMDDIQYRLEDGQVVIYTTSPITRFLEEGTKPHIIRPKNGKALAFRAGNSGKRSNGSTYSFGDNILAGAVHHPGFEARPFFSAALFLSKQEIEDVLSGK